MQYSGLVWMQWMRTLCLPQDLMSMLSAPVALLDGMFSKKFFTSALFTVLKENLDLIFMGKGKLRLLGCNLFWVTTPISEKKMHVQSLNVSYVPFKLVSFKQSPYSTSKSASSSYLLPSEELRTESGVTFEAFCVLSSAIHIDCLQYSKRVSKPSRIVRHDSNRFQTPNSVVFYTLSPHHSNFMADIQLWSWNLNSEHQKLPGNLKLEFGFICLLNIFDRIQQVSSLSVVVRTKSIL